MLLIHRLARLVDNPGAAHAAARERLLRCLAATFDEALIAGNRTQEDSRCDAGFRMRADASHENAELEFEGNAFLMVFVMATAMQGRSFAHPQLAASSCEAE